MIVSESLTDTLNLGRAIARHARPGDIICLFGELGSGKTLLTKGIAWGLGIKRGKIISPTFVLIRHYREGRLPLCHLDLYRLKDDNDILALGYEEYLYDQAGIAVIEWADRLKYLLPREYLWVQLLVKGECRRAIRLKAFGERYRQLLKEIYADIRHRHQH